MTGATGATGATGTCTCPCRSQGEMVVNGGMEAFTNNIPQSWTTTTSSAIAKVTQQGRVHSGLSAVNIADKGNLRQDVPITGGCYYDFSFFARGEGAQVGVDATVTFINDQGLSVTGLTIHVRDQDIPNDNREFAYYRGITTQAPSNATAARIQFVVTAGGGQSMDLDDVSFSVD